MHLSSLLLWLSLGALVECATGSEWCYTGCEHTPAHWGIVSTHCEGERQSPIDIITSLVKTDHKLLEFTLNNFNSKGVIKNITNNGHTVKLTLEEDAVEVSGGGLDETYSTVQFHFHWGDTEHHPGSEHMIDGHRYPMEMHIVSLKKGLTVEEAKKDPTGIAVLGFFINTTDDGDMSGPWKDLTSHVTNITDTLVNIESTFSITDLIGKVNLTKFYRYMGSLTTPDCNEAVVWTVFQEPININKNLIQLFPNKTEFNNVFRPPQALHNRQVYASPATSLPPSHAWCYDDHCGDNPSQWHLLPNSHCDGERQSPIDIDTKSIVVDEHLDTFTFTKFDDKHAIENMINTGHTVKCNLKEGMLEVSGGGLEHVYSTLQFHFHWGSTSASSGSEHTVDLHRYPMEMHIVNKRKDLDLEQAVNTPDGLAVLGFFIEATDSTKSSGGSDSHETEPASTSVSNTNAWKKLTNYLLSIKQINSEIEVTEEISIDDLLGSVDRDSYYRYNGSLTTPSCNEAVVWTVFKESIKIDKSLMMMFPTRAGYENVYRPVQKLHERRILTRSSASSTSGPFISFLLPACLSAFFM